MSLTSAAAEPQPGLAWRFESSNVDSVTNLAPSSQVSPGPARLQGSAALVTDAPTSNTAVYFPGTTGAYMDLGASSATNINQNTSNIFIEAWVYFIDFSVAHRIFVRTPDVFSGAGTVDIVFRTSSTTLYFNYGIGGIAGGANGPSALTAGRWYHVAISSVVGGGNSYCFIDGVPGTGIVVAQDTYNASYTSIIGAGSSEYSKIYIRDLRVVQGGIVPTATFTPGSAPFSYSLPSYVTGSGSTVFTLLSQFVTYNPIGKYGSSLVLNNNPAWNGSNVYSVYSVLLNSTNTFSVSFWTKVTTVKPNGLNYAAMIGFRGSPVSNASAVNYFDLFQNANNGVLGFYGQNGAIVPSSYSPFINSTTTPAVGTWYHMTWVVNSSNFTLYVNGTQSGTTPVVGNAFTVTNMYLATTSQYLSGQSFSGELDDLRIYNTVLTAAQVRSVYSSQGAPAPSLAMPLPRLAWDFNGTTMDYVKGLAGTTVGSVSYNSNGKYGSSIVIINPPATTANYVNYTDTTLSLSGTTGFAISMWVKVNGSLDNSLQYIINMTGPAAEREGLLIQINSTNNRLGFQCYDNASSLKSCLSATTPTIGLWYHTVSVITGSSLIFYLNGILAAGPVDCNTTGKVFGYSPTHNINFRLGGGINTGSGRALRNGELDDLRIFDQSLTSLQVQAIYNQQGMPGRGALVPQSPQPSLAWQFQSSNVDSVTGLAPNLSTTGNYAAASGGTITTTDGKRLHNFSTVGTTSITFNVPVTAEVLVVAGGGGGGAVSSTTFSPGGGGGAGEVYYSASYFIPAGTYTVTVGDGGAGGPQGGASQNGSNSVFGSISAAGGGHGGDGGGIMAGDGGSGGGAARQQGAGGSSVKTAGGQGNNGGASTGFSGAGGGGAGGVGVNQTDATTSSVGTAGGAGVVYPISVLTYGVGGRGGSRTGGTSGAIGANNTGNGGGGAGTLAGATGGKGGSGRVLISYVSALYPAPTYVPGIYRQAINFNNTLAASGSDPNCYATYNVSSFNLSSNSTTMSLWLNSGLNYPVTSGTNPFYVNLQGGNYNGLYTESATSNISFRTGAAPAITVGNVAAQTGVWTHHCAVFSNIGAGSSNTITTYYANGSLIGTANNNIQSLTTLNIGCQDTGTNGALCSIDDLRLFNTVLTDSQVQSIYLARGMPGLSVWTKTT
jgi:hypothetical protein